MSPARRLQIVASLRDGNHIHRDKRGDLHLYRLEGVQRLSREEVAALHTEGLIETKGFGELGLKGGLCR